MTRRRAVPVKDIVDSLQSGVSKVAKVAKAIKRVRDAVSQSSNIKPRKRVKREKGKRARVSSSKRAMTKTAQPFTSVIGKKIKDARKLKIPKVRYLRGHYEASGTVTGVECVFVGHTALPFKVAMKYLGLAIVEQYLRDSKISIARIDEVCGKTHGALGDTEGFYSWYITYQSLGENDTQTQVTSVTTSLGDTWEDFALKITNHMLATFFDNAPGYGVQNRRFFEMGIHGRFDEQAPANAIALVNSTRFPQHVVYKCDELHLEIVSTSHYLMQNRTTSASGSSSTDVIDVNPIHGKQYDFKGNRLNFRMSVLGDTAKTQNFFAGNQTGLIATQDKNGATDSWPADMMQYVTKPPAANTFQQSVRSNYVKMLPGEIRRSVLTQKVDKTLNQWLIWLQSTSKGNAQLSAYGDQVDYYRLPFTHSRMFAFEEMCDTSIVATTNTVTIAHEVNIHVKSRGYVKRKNAVMVSTQFKQ